MSIIQLISKKNEIYLIYLNTDIKILKYIKMSQIAIIQQDKCKPTKCNLECKKYCPVNRVGKMCISVEKTDKSASISESLCIGSKGCNICTKKCPFDAIMIVNLPSKLDNERTHRYDNNGFILHRFIIPKPNKITGIIGQNGIGKSTILNIISNKLKPNFGIIEDEIEINKIKDIEDYGLNKKFSSFKNAEIKKFMKSINENKITISYKIQHIDNLLNDYGNKTINEYLEDDNNEFMEILEINKLNKEQLLKSLSGGELQRLIIAKHCNQKKADVYIFDEPTNYLDIKQRLLLAKAIHKLKSDDKYIFIVDHDISIMDFICDNVHLLYGTPSVYGIVSQVHNLREGINQYLNGYMVSENMRIRKDSIDFKLRNPYEYISNRVFSNYPKMTKKYPSIEINNEAGSYAKSEIIVLLGENGTGKTTFLNLLAGLTEPDECQDDGKVNSQMISFKKQRLISDTKYDITVETLLIKLLGDMYYNANFKDEVLNELNIQSIKDNKINNLSGGELQRVHIAICLGNPAEIYLIDEPSAFLDIEQRLIISKMIRRYIYNHNKTAFIVEHDMMMASYLADKIIVFKKENNITNITSPLTPENGLNIFLKELDITMRKDDETGRPRINSYQSTKDIEQKKNNKYYD
jgi:ATP-binding cassette subfamily E protein 1